MVVRIPDAQTRNISLTGKKYVDTSLIKIRRNINYIRPTTDCDKPAMLPLLLPMPSGGTYELRLTKSSTLNGTNGALTSATLCTAEYAYESNCAHERKNKPKKWEWAVDRVLRRSAQPAMRVDVTGCWLALGCNRTAQRCGIDCGCKPAILWLRSVSCLQSLAGVVL